MIRRFCIFFVIGLIVMASPSRAVQVPLSFAVTNPVLNEFGQVLAGTPSVAPLFGIPHVEGALVQVLDVTAGVFPPDTNGMPHPSNIVVATYRIGEGVDPSLPESGLVSGTIASYDRSGSATRYIMLRVFNKPSLEESSFYGNSQTFKVPVFGEPYGTFFASVGATTNQLDTTDADGDGLSRSWEKSYGSDPENPDTDGDGMLDGHEARAGTNPVDFNSLLLMVHLQPAEGNDLVVSWDAVPGKVYQLQYVDTLDEEAEFVNLGEPVAAGGPVASLLIPNGLDYPQRIYRVKLVE